MKLFIEDLTSAGEGVATHEGLKIFVDGALPGETVEAEIFLQKKTYAKAKLQGILRPSSKRVDPICPAFGRCGGCQLMHLTYEAQLEVKRKRVQETLKRIGGIEIEVPPVVPSPKELHYRNKIQLPVRDGKIGLYEKRSHNLIPIEHCYLHEDNTVFNYLKENIDQLEEVRYVLIRSIVTLVTWREPSEKLTAFAKTIPAEGVAANINPTPHNTILGKKSLHIVGKKTLTQTINGHTFNVSPQSFFQVNTLQAEQLYSYAIEQAKFTGTETALDAYCGVGTLSRQIADHAKEVVGIECVPEAIENAVPGKNLAFICGNVEDCDLSGFDVIFLNPPRKGCDPKVLRPCKKMIYISCDPATLARDLKILGMKVESIKCFDMFPQTTHVETVATLVS